MRKLVGFLAGGILMVSLPGCTDVVKNWYNKAADAVGLGGAGGKTASMVVMNVLDKQMFDDCHIKGSVHVPLGDVKTYGKKLTPDTLVVVYCSNYQCSASGIATKQLNDLGLNARAYEGGMAQWYQKGLPYEGPAQKEYLKQVVEKPETDDEVPTVSTEQLHQEMKQHGLL